MPLGASGYGLPQAAGGQVGPAGAFAGESDYLVYQVTPGTNYLALNRLTGVVDFSTVNAASAINQAIGALGVRGVAGTVALMGGIVYQCTSKVTLDQVGVDLYGQESMNAGTGGQGTVLQATAAITGGVVQMSANNTTLRGVQVDGNSLADYGIRCMAASNVVRDCSAYNAKAICLWLDGPSGASRCTVSNFICPGGPVGVAAGTLGLKPNNVGSTPNRVSTGTNIQIEGPDHLINQIRNSSGPPAGGYCLFVGGQHLEMTTGHITTNAGSQGNSYIENTGNLISDIIFDTGPDGTAGAAATAQVVVNGPANIFDGCTFFNSKVATSHAVLIIKDSAGAFRIGNIFSGCRWESGGIAWADAIAFNDETGAVPANMSRFTTMADGTIDSGTTARTNVALGTVNNGNFMRMEHLYLTANSTTQPLNQAGNAIGTAVFSGTGAQTAFVVTHNMGEVPLFVLASGLSAACTPIASITAISSTQFTVNFTTAPAAGANNVTIGYYCRN